MRKRKKTRKKWFSIIVFILFLLVAVASMPRLNGSSVTPTPPLTQKPEATPVIIYTEARKPEEKLWVETNIAFIEAGYELILVNSEYPIKDDNEIITVSAYREVPLFKASIELNKKLLDAIKEMFADAKKVGYDNFFVNSGYRSEEEQREIYDEAEDKAYVNYPGESEHQTGLAADIAVKGQSGEQMGKSREGKWLEENAWKYGLILRYPTDKAEITGVPYEPWHFRYVGVTHAYFCYKNNLCLEEYIDYMKKNGEYKITFDGTEYQVFYQTPENDIIKLPVNNNYEISADNTGGYIITTGLIVR